MINLIEILDKYYFENPKQILNWGGSEEIGKIFPSSDNEPAHNRLGYKLTITAGGYVPDIEQWNRFLEIQKEATYIQNWPSVAIFQAPRDLQSGEVSFFTDLFGKQNFWDYIMLVELRIIPDAGPAFVCLKNTTPDTFFKTMGSIELLQKDCVG